jgi:hypothetical protein
MADFDNSDIVRLAFVQRYGTGTSIVNVVHVRLESGANIDFATFAVAAGEYGGYLYAPLAPVITNAQVADYIAVTNVTQGRVWGQANWLGYTGGNAATEALPPQVCLLCWGRTTLPRVQLRKYLGVFTEANMNSGIWAAAIVAAGVTWMGNHIAPWASTGGTTFKGGAYRDSDGRFTTAVSVASTQNPVIQRRRRVGTGT